MNFLVQKRITFLRLSVLAWGLFIVMMASAETVELVPFGDFENWITRNITESGIIGGNTRTIYAVGPTRTINGNKPLVSPGTMTNPWSVSNAYAKVVGIEKAAGTTVPEARDGGGTACRMDVKLTEVVVLGMINLRVMIAGTIFTGKTYEPVSNAGDAYANVEFGVPFTRCPSALQLDYKAVISPERTYTIGKAGKALKTAQGHDEAEAYLFLQKRWEDENGVIHAVRVGTAYERFDHTVSDWQNAHRIPVHYGDITKLSDYQSYMGLNSKPFRARNSKGKLVPIKEEGYDPNATPTHIVIMLTSGSQEAWAGHEGNTFWVDNVSLVYK